LVSVKKSEVVDVNANTINVIIKWERYYYLYY
jgi:hypothetical protein